MTKANSLVRALVLTTLGALLIAPVAAQERTVLSIKVKTAALTVKVGQSVRIEAEAVGPDGRPASTEVTFRTDRRGGITVARDGTVSAQRAGQFTVTVAATGAEPQTITVSVPFPELAAITVDDPQGKIYIGESRLLSAKAIDELGGARADLTVAFSSNDPKVAAVDEFNQVTGVAPGNCTISATAGGMSATFPLNVVLNPVTSIDLDADATKVRTGDVVHLTTVGRDANGRPISDAPILLSIVAMPDDTRGPGATGQIEQDGRFVAEKPGLYTILATSGGATARKTIQASPRNVRKRVEVVGRGQVTDVHTSDLWVWEHPNGRDYAVTGTWGANGDTHFWDVTDPTEIQRIATINVDARTVNDVKVSEDGTLVILSREGASNRRNGIVLVDVNDPAQPKIISTFDDQLTGGVHNLFIYEKHVYALSAGRRYDIINIEDRTSPFRVGSFELDTERKSIHDVWVEDGIAYSSNWSNGVVLVDVGNGVAGGTPSNPVKMSSLTYPSGWNHAAFPFRSQATGKSYVIAGDESFPTGLNTAANGVPSYAAGWMHFLDFTDMENPKEVARYEVPEAGTHNLWVEDDILYAAYYNGGLRVVDISGDLMGDLYRQGREIAYFLSDDPQGMIKNAPFVWGPQPFKGNIFFSDHNSGLWCVKLVENTGRRR